MRTLVSEPGGASRCPWKEGTCRITACSRKGGSLALLTELCALWSIVFERTCLLEDCWVWAGPPRGASAQKGCHGPTPVPGEVGLTVARPGAPACSSRPAGTLVLRSHGHILTSALPGLWPRQLASFSVPQFPHLPRRGRPSLVRAALQSSENSPVTRPLDLPCRLPRPGAGLNPRQLDRQGNRGTEQSELAGAARVWTPSWGVRVPLTPGVCVTDHPRELVAQRREAEPVPQHG